MTRERIGSEGNRSTLGPKRLEKLEGSFPGAVEAGIASFLDAGIQDERNSVGICRVNGFGNLTFFLGRQGGPGPAEDGDNPFRMFFQHE
jgi:hypothetical protein